MPRLKAPLFSFQAHGTLSSNLTYASSRDLHVAKTIPTHLDAHTLAQLRHRFLYRLGIALWNGMASGERAGYAALAVGHNYSAMNVWLREWLTTYPNLILCQTIDEGDGVALVDISPSAWPATLFGPTWEGIQGARYVHADGVDDYAHLSSNVDLSLDTAAWSIVLRCRLNAHDSTSRLLDKALDATGGWAFYQRPVTAYGLATNTAGATVWSSSTVGTLVPNVWNTLGLSCTYPDVLFYRNGSDVTFIQAVHLIPTAKPFRCRYFNSEVGPARPSDMDLAWIVAFDRELTPAEQLAIHTLLSIPI